MAPGALGSLGSCLPVCKPSQATHCSLGAALSGCQVLAHKSSWPVPGHPALTFDTATECPQTALLARALPSEAEGVVARHLALPVFW